jgi:hypothetical protein
MDAVWPAVTVTLELDGVIVNVIGVMITAWVVDEDE